MVKESVQLLVSLLCLRRGKMLEGALPAGKVCTAVLFSSLTLLVLFPRIDPGMVYLMAGIDAAFLLFSFSAYLLAFRELEA